MCQTQPHCTLPGNTLQVPAVLQFLEGAQVQHLGPPSEAESQVARVRGLLAAWLQEAGDTGGSVAGGSGGVDPLNESLGARTVRRLGAAVDAMPQAAEAAGGEVPQAFSHMARDAHAALVRERERTAVLLQEVERLRVQAAAAVGPGAGDEPVVDQQQQQQQQQVGGGRSWLSRLLPCCFGGGGGCCGMGGGTRGGRSRRSQVVPMP